MHAEHTNTQMTGPAWCGLRLCIVALLALGLTAACAGTPANNTEDGQLTTLEDRSEETDYDLHEIASRLHQAQMQGAEGRRTLASSIYDTAHGLLPEDATRDRAYVRLLQASMWALPGTGQDSARAREYLTTAERAWDDSPKGQRLMGDVMVVHAYIALAEGDADEADEMMRHADAAYSDIGAHARRVDTAIGLALSFQIYGDADRTEYWARHAHGISRRLDADEFHLQTCIEAASLLPKKRDQWLHEAYEAAYRIGDMGWRNAVIAAAVEQWYEAGNWAECVRWGDRLRDRDQGALPEDERFGLYLEDVFDVLARYADARVNAGMVDARTENALARALALLERLGRNRITEYAAWKEKLQSGLLQSGED
jgi:hypothetical protein